MDRGRGAADQVLWGRVHRVSGKNMGGDTFRLKYSNKGLEPEYTPPDVYLMRRRVCQG